MSLALAIPWLAAVALAPLDGRRRWVIWLASAVLAVELIALAALALSVFEYGPQRTVAGGWPPGVGIVLRADALGIVFALLSGTVLLAALSREAVDGARHRTFPALVLILQTGLTGLFLTGDVFNFYVFFELSMIASYVLAYYGGEAPQARSALIFAVVNLLGSFIFLIAVAAIYHVTGTLEMTAVADRLSTIGAETTAVIAVSVFVAFGVKLGLFPFHFWLPSVYGNARAVVAAILGGAVANIGSYGLIRFGGELFPEVVRFAAPALLVIASATILYGSVQAIARRTAVEVLAYSAIGQAGYVLLALVIGGTAGYGAAILYALVTGLNKVLLFLAAPGRGRLVGTAFAVGAFSVAGIPPAAGFFGKLAVFESASASPALLALLFLGSALSVIYMFQIYQHDFWREPKSGRPASRAAHAPVVLLAAAVVALGLWPEPLLSASRGAATALQGGSP